MIGYHASIGDNLKSILKNGLTCNNKKIWTVSEDAVYFYGDKHIKENFFNEETSEKNKNDALLNEAILQSSATLAYAKDCRAVIVKFEVPDDEVCDDDSCPFTSANCIYRDVKPSEIKSVMVSKSLEIFKGFFLSMMIGRELAEDNFSQRERDVAKLFKNMYDYEVNEVFSEFVSDSLKEVFIKKSKKKATV